MDKFIEVNPLRAKLLIVLVIVACGALIVSLHDIRAWLA
jgi:hypothetical protein